MVRNLPAMKEIQVQSPGWKDPLEEEMATHSSILAWRIPWTEQPGGLQSMGSQRVRHDWAANTSTFIYMCVCVCVLKTERESKHSKGQKNIKNRQAKRRHMYYLIKVILKWDCKFRKISNYWYQTQTLFSYYNAIKVRITKTHIFGNVNTHIYLTYGNNRHYNIWTFFF